MAEAADASREEAVDAVVVGAGFAGLYMLYKMRILGLTARGFEAGTNVGGTWYWNRYPGARCDVDSLEYSFSFSEELQQEWTWSERFATQPEILSYLDHVADRFDLRREISFETRVTAAVFDEADGTWAVQTDRGHRLRCRYCIMATGNLSDARLPDIPGIETFAGPIYHTGRWPKEAVAFEGKRVAVIGTGSSGIQAVPAIAETAAHVTVFQRTPNFSIPARNAPQDPEQTTRYKSQYAEKRRDARKTSAGILYDYNDIPALSVDPERRQQDYEARWLKGGVNFIRTYADISLSEPANETAAEFVRGKIRSIVNDQKTAEMLLPRDHPIGTKRICVDSGYFQAFNRDNVGLVDLRKTPIAAITADQIRTTDATIPTDILVLATGYDAVTGTLARIDIRGRGGVGLSAKWADGPRSYLGLMSAGFPNLFTVTGPGSPGILTNVVVSIEQHVEWIADCIGHMESEGLALIEPEQGAEDAWVDHVQEVAGKTLMVKAKSWYMGANIPGKPRLFLPYAGGFYAFKQKCDAVVANGYEGFRFTSAPRPETAAA